VHEVARKWPISWVDEAIANVDHQIVISELRRPHSGQKNAARRSSCPITRRLPTEPVQKAASAAAFTAENQGEALRRGGSYGTRCFPELPSKPSALLLLSRAFTSRS